jgi:hypothetical protein
MQIVVQGELSQLQWLGVLAGCRRRDQTSKCDHAQET